MRIRLPALGSSPLCSSLWPGRGFWSQIAQILVGPVRENSLGARCCVPAWVANAMPSYSKLTKYSTSRFAACCYLQGRGIIVSSSDQSGAHRHCVKNATDRLKIGRQMEARGKGAKGEACQLCRRLKTYRKSGNKQKETLTL